MDTTITGQRPDWDALHEKADRETLRDNVREQDLRARADALIADNERVLDELHATGPTMPKLSRFTDNRSDARMLAEDACKLSRTAGYDLGLLHIDRQTAIAKALASIALSMAFKADAS